MVSNKDTKGYGPRVWVNASHPVATWIKHDGDNYPTHTEYLSIDEHNAILQERDARIMELEGRLDESLKLDLDGIASSAMDKKKIATLEARVKELEKSLETERMRLSACGVAALGYYKEPVAEEYKSASLADVLWLRSQLERAKKVENRLRVFLFQIGKWSEEGISLQAINAVAKATKEDIASFTEQRDLTKGEGNG